MNKTTKRRLSLGALLMAALLCMGVSMMGDQLKSLLAPKIARANSYGPFCYCNIGINPVTCAMGNFGNICNLNTSNGCRFELPCETP